MNIMDFAKATMVCGTFAFLIYTFPILGQAVVIGILSLVWALYAHSLVRHFRRR